MVQFYIDPQLQIIIIAALLTLTSVVAWALLGRNVRSVYKAIALGFCWLLFTGAIIKSGASTDNWTIDPTSKAGRVSAYDTTGRDVSIQSKRTYGCSGSFTPAATPTDLVTLTGSATTTIRVISLYLATQNTAAGSQIFLVIKRSTADTTGTFVTGTNVPLDSNDAAATAVCGHYTANPGALGTAVGTINTVRVASPVLVPATFAGVVQDSGYELLPWYDRTLIDKAVTLRGIAQQLAINFNGAALVAGQIHNYRIVWMEE